jgi:hypothetical protein
MPRTVLAALAVLALIAGAVFADEAEFTEMTGIPVLEGLLLVPDSLIVFDKEEGRIVEAAFEGESALAEARTFYPETLFQLGWEPEREGGSSNPDILTFTREGERLTVEFAEGPPAQIRFRLGPAG